MPVSCALPSPAHPPPRHVGDVGGGSRRAGGFLRQRQGWASELALFKLTAAFQTFGNTGRAEFLKFPLFSRRVRSPRGGEKQNQENR